MTLKQITKVKKFLPKCFQSNQKTYKPKQKKTYERLLTIAESIVYNRIPFIDITDGALFYHADYVTPSWAKTKIRTVEIEDHIFYRWEVK